VTCRASVCDLSCPLIILGAIMFQIESGDRLVDIERLRYCSCPLGPDVIVLKIKQSQRLVEGHGAQQRMSPCRMGCVGRGGGTVGA
jgi:hypothetical protein